MPQNISNTPVNLNILLVSEDDFMLKVYQKLFTKYHHWVITANQPQTALKLVAGHLGFRPVDLVFIDQRCYRLNWEWFTERFQAIDKNLTLAPLPTSLLSNVKEILDRLSLKKQDMN